MSEQILIERLKERDQQAFKQFVEQYKDKIFRLAMGFVHDIYLAEDITQDVFIKLWNNIPQWEDKGNKISTWLYRVTVNEAINYVRKKNKTSYLSDLTEFTRTDDDGAVEMQIEDYDRDPQGLLENKELAKILKKAVNSLPKKQRVAFVLSKYQNMSAKEIAEVMEISPGNVDVIIHRAKKKLQKQILKLMK